ncbi:B2L14 protein, partial [Chordeiles acutipennis]|nr:B2L14 protein [Chordeiles acutipennis]
GTKMSSSNDDSMEEILQEDDERDSIEYKILMAYAQRRLSVSKYRKLLNNEANARKSSSLLRRKVKADRQGDKEGPIQGAVFQGGAIQHQSKKQPRRNYLPGYHLPFLCGRGNQERPPMLSLYPGYTTRFSVSEAQSESLQEGNSQNQTSETAVVNHIADQLAKLVTSRSQEPPSDVSFQTPFHDPCQEQGESDPTDGSEGKEHAEEEIIQTIVSLLKQSGDQLEEKIKKDRVFYKLFTDMLSYTFFERIADLFLENVSADSTREPEGQVQCVKVAFTMEIATRLTAVDNHPMNLVLGFGLKYLREHFKPWIQDQGGWVCILPSL